MGIKIVPKSKSFGQNVLDTASSVGSTVTGLASLAGSAAIGAVTDTANKVGKAFSDAKGLVTDQTNNNSSSLKKLESVWKSIQGEQDADMFPIGRACKFNPNIDNHQRFSNYLKSKMSVIDLIPIDYQINFNRLTELIQSQKEMTEKQKTNTEKNKDQKTANDSKENKIIIGNLYSYGYKDKIKLFQKLCDHHGLSSKYAGIRLFTTDDTTGYDTINIQYKDSTFQGITDGLFSMGQTFRDLASGVLGSGMKEFSDTVTKEASSGIGAVVGEMGLSPEIQKLTENLASMAGDMVMKGNKMTFPKVWQSTTYNGNLSVNIRLISPYGHPKAVKEFILKPLSYLLLLAAPQTINGVTYGGSIPLTIKAYGLNYTVLGSIASITFRRGGSDSSFNLYRQPLTIDLSIEFQTLFDAFAVADPSVFGESMNLDKDIFKKEMFADPSGSQLNLYSDGMNTHMMTTLGTILTSFRPVKMLDMNVDPQIYGLFQPPSRDDIPNSPAFTPLTGNLGSSISSSVSSIGKFAKMVTNAPALIQQGLSNAVYNMAKGSVSSIAGSASGWMKASSSTVTGVVNKVNALF